MSVILYDRVHSVEMHQNHEKPNGLFVCVLFYFILFQNVRKLNYYLDNKKGKTQESRNGEIETIQRCIKNRRDYCLRKKAR